MKRNGVKTTLILITASALFVGGFYLSSQRTQTDSIPTSQNLVLNKEDALKEKLVTDFEKAFIKQYTPLVGCEDLFAENKTANCKMHMEQAKNEFKNEFILNRGLPKNTFENLKLSLVD